MELVTGKSFTTGRDLEEKIGTRNINFPIITQNSDQWGYVLAIILVQ